MLAVKCRWKKHSLLIPISLTSPSAGRVTKRVGGHVPDRDHNIISGSRGNEVGGQAEGAGAGPVLDHDVSPEPHAKGAARQGHVGPTLQQAALHELLQRSVAVMSLLYYELGVRPVGGCSSDGLCA